MTSSIFVLIAVACLLELDTTYAFQFTLSRGIIAGPLLSLITGDLMAGVQVGVFTELLFADVNPLGGILPPSAVTCCAVSLALHGLCVPLYIAFFFGVVSAVLFAYAERTLRKYRIRWLVKWEERIIQTPSLIYRPVFISLAAYAFMSLILILLFVLISSPVALWLTEHLPEKAHLACKFSFIAIPWIGIATLISSFRLKAR
jgi:mannose/fructose/N-acetylgalactosamine-specific phosphotransferase system component IIC